jgi:hypothetical protein
VMAAYKNARRRGEWKGRLIEIYDGSLLRYKKSR